MNASRTPRGKVGTPQEKKTKQSKIIKEESTKVNVLGNDWRSYMPVCREVANEMCVNGKLDILQGGKTIDPIQGYKGPIRLRLPLTSPLFEK